MYPMYPINTKLYTPTITVDLTQVQFNDDNSVTVGNPNSSICINENVLLELLTKNSENHIK